MSEVSFQQWRESLIGTKNNDLWLDDAWTFEMIILNNLEDKNEALLRLRELIQSKREALKKKAHNIGIDDSPPLDSRWRYWVQHFLNWRTEITRQEELFALIESRNEQLKQLNSEPTLLSPPYTRAQIINLDSIIEKEYSIQAEIRALQTRGEEVYQRIDDIKTLRNTTERRHFKIEVERRESRKKEIRRLQKRAQAIGWARVYTSEELIKGTTESVEGFTAEMREQERLYTIWSKRSTDKWADNLLERPITESNLKISLSKFKFNQKWSVVLELERKKIHPTVLKTLPELCFPLSLESISEQIELYQKLQRQNRVEHYISRLFYNMAKALRIINYFDKWNYNLIAKSILYFLYLIALLFWILGHSQA